MKIRYYLRGLGLGILVTAIFFMVSDNSSGTMSDEMIKERARELGMTESVVLAELATQEETVAETEDTTVEETIAEIFTEEEDIVTGTEDVTTEEATEVETVVEEVEEETSEEESVVEETTQEQTKEESSEVIQETEENVGTNTEPVTILVNRGEGSDTVSKRLQEAGLVADAYEYDRYLMANGYDKRIGAGEHVIPAGATWEEIARILCNM